MLQKTLDFLPVLSLLLTPPLCSHLLQPVLQSGNGGHSAGQRWHPCFLQARSQLCRLPGLLTRQTLRPVIQACGTPSQSAALPTPRKHCPRSKQYQVGMTWTRLAVLGLSQPISTILRLVALIQSFWLLCWWWWAEQNHNTSQERTSSARRVICAARNAASSAAS